MFSSFLLANRFVDARNSTPHQDIIWTKKVETD